MSRRINISLIFLIVYFAIYIVAFVVLPMYFHIFRLDGAYFPLFFFFPFIFGRRGFRRKTQSQGNSGSNAQGQSDEILNGTYDTRGWEKRKATQYDEYGIQTRKSVTRYWYYIGMAIVIVAGLLFLFIRGF